MNKVASYVFFNQKTGNLRKGWKAAEVATAGVLGIWMVAHAEQSFGQKYSVKLLYMVENGRARNGDTIFYYDGKNMNATTISVQRLSTVDDSKLVQSRDPIPDACEDVFIYRRGDEVTLTTVFKHAPMMGTYEKTEFVSGGKKIFHLKSIDGIEYSIPLNAIKDIKLGY